jgi:hypothetical protein
MHCEKQKSALERARKSLKNTTQHDSKLHLSAVVI